MTMRKLQLTELNRKSQDEFHQSPKWPVRIILDNLRSAHNIGSVFRTADAFLTDKIYLCGITACPPNREISKTALGATESVAWQYCENTLQAIEDCKAAGYQIVVIEQTTESVILDDFNPEGPVALVFGNEVNGVSDAVLPACDAAVEIPQFGTKHSFNVSVCAGIILYAIQIKMKV
jgi:23S rRNA (guanosine2251-2'-O)-methyltransferase